MYNKILFAIFSIVILTSVKAQIGGNQLYQNKSVNYDRSAVETRSIFSTDTTVVVTSRVLLNKLAQSYIITIGVNSFAKTVIEANQLSTKRIEKVIEKIKQLGITKDDIYVDFISETKMYDHTVTDREIKEYFDGFSIRKNLIIKTNKLSNFDKIIEICSEQEIYDIVKVDYKSDDIEKINKELFDEAIKIASNKALNFSNSSSIKLKDNYRIASESLKIYYPKNLYKQYNEAFETSLVNNYYNTNHIKREIRKERTFYYEGMDTEIGVDKIIDNLSPIVGIQYVMEIIIIYDVKKKSWLKLKTDPFNQDNR